VRDESPHNMALRFPSLGETNSKSHKKTLSFFVRDHCRIKCEINGSNIDNINTSA
jgi:hypothetical protein